MIRRALTQLRRHLHGRHEFELINARHAVARALEIR